MTLPDFTIREATENDAAAITHVYVDSWICGFGPRMPRIEADPARIERWRRDLGPVTPTRWWIAESSRTLLGFVGIGPCRDPIQPDLGELDTIAVTPDAWNRGIGRQLMSVALGGLRADGYSAAALWTLSNYPRGDRFYLSNGWRLNGSTRNNGNQARYDHDLALSMDQEFP